MATPSGSRSDMSQIMEGGCSCRHLRYRLTKSPLFVHCCHCTWCQRETGSAFVINAMIESAFVETVAGKADRVLTPSASGKGQMILRCPHCRVAVWSHYSGAGPAASFVRAGTLDEAWRMGPDIHIFTSTKLPWVVLPENVPAVEEYYDRDRYWPAQSLARREAMLTAARTPR